MLQPLKLLSVLSPVLMCLVAYPAYGANECRISYAYEMGTGAGTKSFTDYKYIDLGNAINIDRARIKWVRNLQQPQVTFDFSPTFGVADITLGQNQRNPVVADFVNKPTLLKAICLTPPEESGVVAAQAAAAETVSKAPGQVARAVGRKTDQARASVLDQTGNITGAQPRINAVGDGHVQNTHPANAVAPTQQKPLKYGLNRVTITGSNLGGITRINGLPAKASVRFVGRAPNYLNVDIRIPTEVPMRTAGSATLVAGRTTTNQRWSWIVAGKRSANVVDLYPITARGAGTMSYTIGTTTRSATLNGQVRQFRQAYPTSLCARVPAGQTANAQVQPAIPVPAIDVPDFRWGVGVSNQDAEQHNLSGSIVVELWRANSVLDRRTLRGMQLVGSNREIYTTRRASSTIQVYRVAGDRRRCWTLDNPTDSLVADNTVFVRVDTGGAVQESNEGNNQRDYFR